MNEIIAALSRLIGQVIFWATVKPWEQCIRVRAGRWVKRLKPGLHFRIPIVDEIFKQACRLRNAHVTTQTLSTADGATVVVGATIGYEIVDIERLYNSLDHGEDTVGQITAAAIAACVFASARDRATPEAISLCVTAQLAGRFDSYGLALKSVCITDFAFVRAIRLVMDQRYGGYGDRLTTQATTP